jgi:hypothetical protein
MSDALPSEPPRWVLHLTVDSTAFHCRCNSVAVSQFELPLEAWMSVCIYSVFVLSSVQVAALRRAILPSKESYRLRMRLRNWKSSQGPKGCRAREINVLSLNCKWSERCPVYSLKQPPPTALINTSEMNRIPRATTAITTTIIRAKQHDTARTTRPYSAHCHRSNISEVTSCLVQFLSVTLLLFCPPHLQNNVTTHSLTHSLTHSWSWANCAPT